jgi:aarF domain-containing kinase
MVRNLLRRCTEKVRVNLIDVGMVISLDEIDRSNFVNFIKSVIHSDGEGCAKMIFSLSNFEGQKIVMGKFDEYLSDLRELFSALEGADLDDLDGMTLFGGMLNLIRSYQMKLDGEFATLLTNMMVLEAVAKDVDPGIKLLKVAIPYFSYIEDTELVESLLEKKGVDIS